MNQFSGGKREASFTDSLLSGRKQARVDTSEQILSVETDAKRKRKSQKKLTANFVDLTKRRESSASSTSSGNAEVRRSKEKRKQRLTRKRKPETKQKSKLSEHARKKKGKKKQKREKAHQTEDESSCSESLDDGKRRKKSKKSSVELEAVKKRKKKKDKKVKKAKTKASKKVKAEKALRLKSSATSSAASLSKPTSAASSASSARSSRTTSPAAAVAAGPCPYDHSDPEADAADPDPDCPPLRPIADYLDDRTEMLHQMFSAARGRQLCALVPEEFRRLPLTRLRDRCLPLLQGMSAKRIRRILAGESAASISSSDTDESVAEQKADAADADAESTTAATAAAAVVGVSRDSTPMAVADSTTTEDPTEARCAALSPVPIVTENNDDDATNEIEAASVHSNSEAVMSLKADATVEAESQADAVPAEEAQAVTVENEPAEESVTEEKSAASEESEDLADEKEELLSFSAADAEADSVILNEVVDLSDVEDESAAPPRPQPSVGGKSRRQLEIMELEMRARAIQAMLSAKEKSGSSHTAM